VFRQFWVALVLVVEKDQVEDDLEVDAHDVRYLEVELEVVDVHEVANVSHGS